MTFLAPVPAIDVNVNITEKRFEHYPFMQGNIKSLIVEQMGTIERCRFTRCSKMCEEDAKSSKNYIYGLKVVVFSRENLYVELLFGNKSTYRRCRTHFYKTNQNTLKSKNIYESDRTNQLQLGIKYFEKILVLHQPRIKMLEIRANGFEIHFIRFNFIIKNMNSLEHLEIDNSVNILRFNLNSRPMKTLSITGTNNTNIVTERQLQLNVSNHFIMPQLKLNYEQLRQLSAKHVHVHIGELKEKGIFNLIRCWQDGLLGKQNARYEWTLDQTGFEISNLVQLVGDDTVRISQPREQYREQYYVSHRVGNCRYATLFLSASGHVLTFLTDVPKIPEF